jgi:hypothetical protein
VAIVSPIAGHCGTRGRQSTSVSCSSDSRAAGMKLSPASFIAAANSGERHSDSRLMPERLAGPANFHEVRACVSAEVAQTMKSQVAFFAFSESAALIGNPQFQIDVTRLPLGPLGHRAYAILPTTFDFSGLVMTAAEECASMYVATVAWENASAMSGQFQLRTAGGAYFVSVSTYHVSARTASGEFTTIALPAIQLPPKPRSSDG